MKLPVLTESGKETENDFSSELLDKHVTGEPCILIGTDRCWKWLVDQVCKSTEAKEVINVLEFFIKLYGVPKKIKSDRGSAFISKDSEMFCKKENIEVDYSPPRLQTGTRAVERTIQALRNLNIANLEDHISFMERSNRALTVMLFTLHTRLKVSPLELHHGRKLRT